MRRALLRAERRGASRIAGQYLKRGASCRDRPVGAGQTEFPRGAGPARRDADLSGRGLGRARALASIVRLLDTGRIRVGNEDYARTNGSFGATTLRRRHARLKSDGVHLRFEAKSGRTCEMTVTDRGLLRFVKQLMDIPGQTLFRYRDEDGRFHAITSSLVNDYIREAGGGKRTAKDFRTWRASVLAFTFLRDNFSVEGAGERRSKTCLRMSRAIWATPPAIVCKAYIHPQLIAAARAPSPYFLEVALPRRTRWLSRYERGLMAFLATPGDEHARGETDEILERSN
ncbi:hypothetical protein MTR62_05600 [Novosphingobium sp. 1949]|uniref:DNA topoisomerase I catalytic core eukaryotic-type domain-containing protein n=2 Tax=Novosphingobium organovorum TaxID=2930092 RepID=A0ABT0BBK0_9SPHN|nr:hypothetical protein [Novosphingobium organovorum]